MKTSAIIALIILAAIAAFLLLRPHTPPAPSVGTAAVPEGATVVRLTADGFVPSELSIRKGETVAFVTENGKLFWPASNLHPSHGLYPEFDPKMPIQPDESWSFTFEKAGTWPFHDHLAPYYTGTITVTE